MGFEFRKKPGELPSHDEREIRGAGEGRRQPSDRSEDLNNAGWRVQRDAQDTACGDLSFDP